MVKTVLSDPKIVIENTANLSAVTSATNGSDVDMRWYNKGVVFVSVSSNTGAVTVTIQVSPDAGTWYDRYTHTYTATNSNDIYELDMHYPYVRVTTSTQSSSTVTATICGRS